MSSDNTKPIVWTIAGSDSGGGAGIQADLATFNDFAVHGCSVITALTAQNSLGVYRITAVDTAHIKKELQILFDDLSPAVIKLGMLADTAIISCIQQGLGDYHGPIICDPVLKASVGEVLLNEEGMAELKKLFPRITLLTPNIFEAEQLTGLSIESFNDIEQAADALLAQGLQSVIITGGDANNKEYCFDFYRDSTQHFWIRGERVNTHNNHGTGCTFSSAIAAALARGYELVDAIVLAKMVVSQGLREAVQIGGGNGPVAHIGWPKGLNNLPVVMKQTPTLFTCYEPPRCGVQALGLYPVVDTLERLERVLKAGAKTVQLRIKTGDELHIRQQIQGAVECQNTYQARLFINDYWAWAIEYGAYGVHLGQEDLDTADLKAIAISGLRLGVSNHSWFEIARAHALRPSYMAIGPIYPTTTKEMRFAPQGLIQLREWVQLLDSQYPIIAIGGIDRGRIKKVVNTGVASVAVVRAITEAEDYVEAVSVMTRLMVEAAE